jgi:hypothetical protein
MTKLEIIIFSICMLIMAMLIVTAFQKPADGVLPANRRSSSFFGMAHLSIDSKNQ